MWSRVERLGSFEFRPNKDEVRTVTSVDQMDSIGIF